MKKHYTLIIVLLFLFLSVSQSFAQQQKKTPVKLQLISEKLYEIIGGRGARGGIYIGKNEILIIDAKMNKNSVDQVIEQIRQISDKPLTYLVNTHSDGDHINGNQYFPETVTFIAHENCRKDFFLPRRDGTPSKWTKPELASYIPSLTFRDKMNIYLGSKKIELWYFGVGHTSGDIVIYFPEEKTAFLGDQIFLTRPQLIHSHKGGNSFEYVKTLTKMLETLDAEKFCSGHSDITDRSTIISHINKIINLQKKIKALIDKNKSPEDIKNEFDENKAELIKVIYKEIKNK